MTAKDIAAVATSVRCLTMDAVEKAKSGHPGLPMGCAELGAMLYGEILKHDPADPRWIDRDRFVLSAGHGCMLLYSLLHLAGYDVSLDDLRNFRQLGSKTPGHPEWGVTPGVEATAGPLGQGLGNAAGMAIAERMLAARFNTAKHTVVDHHTFVLVGDGDMMEGVGYEAASLAGHLGLGKLIVFYDSNRITIEGSTDLAFSEDVLKRYQGFGWRTFSGSMYDPESIRRLVAEARQPADRPAFILLESTIAKGAPNAEGTAGAHGAPLGTEEVKAAKRALGVPEDAAFHVAPEARAYFASRRDAWRRRREEWQAVFDAWSRENPGLAAEWRSTFAAGSPDLSAVAFPAFKAGEALATRAASGKILNAVAKAVPGLVGGSADLAPSNNTHLKDMGDFTRATPAGRNFHFGVREHGMGAVVNGMAYHGGLRPFCATFMVFSDYMRGAVRVAAIAKLPVIYVFTHDSIFVGEDGPTHEPVEHLAALRAIPNVQVLRPADAEETEAAWRMALGRTDGPTVLALSRQNLAVFTKHEARWRETIQRGAYVARDCGGAPDTVIVATGSEVGVALAAADLLADRKVRVVSMMCRERFMAQDRSFREALVPPGARRVVIEAGTSFGWASPFDDGTLVVSIDRFGESGPWQKLAERFGITAAALAERIRSR
ncbi:MAG: transketolase [Spirochaetes bacterium]|nr:transketolase [Spirochaetota bacterium]